MTSWEDSLKKLHSIKNRPDGVSSKEWKNILKGVGELEKRKEAPFDPKKHKALTQSDLAKLFIKWYFAILIIILAYVPIYN